MANKAEFLKSAVLAKDYPPSDRPEIALVGRSNAGKSSLLNAFTGGQKIAKVSQVPGKTRLLNFFDFGAHYRLVDTPGYGFASRSGAEVLEWQKMIKHYFENRDNLIGVVLIMDCRREWQEEEEMLREWCARLELQLIVVLNKADKLTRGEASKIMARRREELPSLNLHMVSAIKSEGVKELEDDIFKSLIKKPAKGKQ